MKPLKGYYSLIQYCPDLSRMEAVNIGVLLFCPEINFIKARTDKTESRVRKLFGLKREDKSRINAMREAIEKRLIVDQENFQTLEDLEKFIQTRANAVQITPPRPMKVFEPEKDLEELFNQLVAEKETEALDDGTQSVPESINVKLEKTFSKDEVKKRLRANLSIPVPALRREVHFPYGFQNGHFNLIQPVPFDAKNRDAVLDKACKYAVEGDLIASHPDPELGDLQLVVVGQFANPQPETEIAVRELLTDYNVRFFGQNDVEVLATEIIQTGKVIAT
jgi:hypothetical protein